MNVPLPKTMFNDCCLQIHSLSVQGSIPKELGSLSELTSLRLAYNSFIGSVPTELGKLKKLELVQLHANRISGKMPNLTLVTSDASNYSLIGNHSFVADCGAPSAFDAPLDCLGCSMCCELLLLC